MSLGNNNSVSSLVAGSPPPGSHSASVSTATSTSTPNSTTATVARLNSLASQIGQSEFSVVDKDDDKDDGDSLSSRSTSFPESIVQQAPEDPLFGLVTAFQADSNPKKVDLGVGAYRDDHGRPWVLPVVTKADQELRKDPNYNHEYLPIAGLKPFAESARNLIAGQNSEAIKTGRIASIQSISGTGALHLGATFLRRFYRVDQRPTIYISNPTWANHKQIFNLAGLPIATYPYFDANTLGLDFDGMTKCLEKAEEGSIILLHACAHNPTGVDPTTQQWAQLADILARKKHFPFFDCAYQGFASGDLDRDASSIRLFIERGFEMVIAQSFAKNFGLYGQRVGCFHYVGPPSITLKGGDQMTSAHVNRISSQLAIIQRSEISNPPAYGARIVAKVLGDDKLFSEWVSNLKEMSGRLLKMRNSLRDGLERLGTPGDWSHVTNQIGMFSFTGLKTSQVRMLRDKWHIYMTDNGRASLTGLNSDNVNYVVEAIDNVVRSGN